MIEKRVFACVVAAALMTGCTVKKSETEEGKEKLEIEPARVEVTTDTKTIKVPNVNIVPDTTKDTIKTTTTSQ